MSAVLLAAMGLATFRLWRVVGRDTWPPAEWLRDVLDHRAGVTSGHTFWNTLQDWALCPWCLGAWIAAGMVVVVDLWFVPLPLPFVQWAAVSAIAGLLAGLDG